MTSESAESARYDGRLRDLEAQAFRTGRTLAEHGEQLVSIRDQQRTAFGHIDSLADTIGAPGERSIARRLDALEGAVGAVRETQLEHGRVLAGHGQELQSHGRMLEQLAGAVGSLVEGQARILERLDEIAPPRQD